MSCLGTSILLIPGDVNCEVNLFKQNRASGQILIFHTAKVPISYFKSGLKRGDAKSRERRREISVKRIYVRKDDSGQDRQRMKGMKRARIWTKWKETRKRKRKREKRWAEERRSKTTRQTWETRESHRSAELFVVYLGDILRYFFYTFCH